MPFFISSYSFCKFIKTNLSWLILESNKALEIKTFILFYLDFALISILLCFFFLIIELHFLIASVITQVFNPKAELVIPIGIPCKEAEAKTEKHLVIIEPKQHNLSLEFCKPFWVFFGSTYKSFWYISSSK